MFHRERLQSTIQLYCTGLRSLRRCSNMQLTTTLSHTQNCQRFEKPQCTEHVFGKVLHGTRCVQLYFIAHKVVCSTGSEPIVRWETVKRGCVEQQARTSLLILVLERNRKFIGKERGIFHNRSSMRGAGRDVILLDRNLVRVTGSLEMR